INAEGKIVYIKYHWKPQQNVRNLSAKEVQEVQGKDFNHATRDLFDAIEKGNYPKWDLHVQVMQLEETDSLDFDPLDPTKVWPEDRFPLIEV
ncbi:catalase, partial [Klebsiella pneumoniae]